MLSFWWAIAHDGAKGFAPGLAIMALLALPVFISKRPKPTPDTIALGAALIWIVLSSFWSPSAGSFFTYESDTGAMAFDSFGFRIALAVVVFTFITWALHTLKPIQYERAVLAARVGIGIQALLFVGWLFFFDAFVAYGLSKTELSELGQNMIRIVNLTTIMIPVFIALLPVRNILIKGAIFLLCLIGMFIISRREIVDSQSSLLILLSLIVIIPAAFFLGRKIYRVLGYLTAALVITMPGFLLAGVNLLGSQKEALPISMQSRVESYGYVLNRIAERPIFGWGVGASSTWKDMYMINVPGIGPVEYQIVPGHPHNASLEIWSETGLIGVLLVAAFVILLGERLARTANLSKELSAAGASLWAGSLCIAAFSYSVWNDAFWGAIIIGGSILLALSRTAQNKQKAVM